VSGIVLDSVSPATTISNQATVTYTSLDGPQAGERDGSDGETGDLNNYARSALAPDIVTVGILEIEKLADRTTATIGEVVTYTVNVTVGEGTTNNVVLSDTLPTGVQFVAGSSQIISNPAGMTITGFDPDSVNQTLTIVNPGVNDRPDVVDSASFSISYDVVVLNVLSNQDFTVLTNSVVATADDLPGDTSDTSVTVREPTLAITKSADAIAPVDAGDSIVYTITITNTSGQTAYEVTLTDPIDPNLTVPVGVISDANVTASGGATVSSGAFEFVDLGGGTFFLQTTAGADIDIPDGGTVELVYTAVVRPDVVVATTIENRANIRWSSLDGGLRGDDPGTLTERTGSDVTDPAPESLDPTSPAGPLNNYALSSPATFTVIADLSVLKEVADTSLGGDDGVVTIGEIVTYRMTVTAPEGIAPELRIQDIIPVGMAYVPDSIQLETTGFAGTVSAPSATPLTGTTFQDGTGVEFVFAQITVDDDNDPDNNTFSFTYQTVVLDVATNNGLGASPTELANTATHNNGGVDPDFAFSAGGTSVTVIEPELVIEKNASIASGDAGDLVIYTITVEHTDGSNSTAYDLLVTDILPASFLPPASLP
jgi:large repetitive protein